MVKLNTKYLIKRNKGNKYFLFRKKGDNDKQFLNRITHLPLQNQFIEQILKMANCENIKKLYLQNNLIRNIENMENFPNLTHLYLQRNFLEKLENLNVLSRLKKIYLGYNQIQVLEGMEHLKEIKEIHLECQDLQVGDTLYFEPLTVLNLGTTLEVLNISDNYLTTIYGLKDMISLRILIAKNNCLQDLDDITNTISGWTNLQEMDLTGNEVTNDRRYRDCIIYATEKLELLDERPIHPNTREFIQKLFKRRKTFYENQKAKAEEGKKEKKKTLKFADECDTKENNFDFTDSFPMPGPVYYHSAWKLRDNVNPLKSKTYLPRPYWKKKGQQSSQ